MAHNLADKRDGSKAMLYTGATPWHELGKAVPRHFTTREAIDHCEMDFTVEKHPIKVNGFNIEIPGKMATVRMDKMIPLGVVGDGYEVIQYVEAFGDFVDSILGYGNAVIETAGLLGNGEKGWIQCKLPGDIKVEGTKGKDVIEKRLTFATSHDGSMPLIAMEVALRIVCQNTFNAALQGKKTLRLSVRHTANAESRMEEVKRIIAHSSEAYAKLSRNVNILAGVGVDADKLSEYLNTLFPDNPKAKNNTRTQNVRDEVTRLYTEGSGQDIPGVKGTMWALYNGVTEYVDYHRSTRGETDANRLSNRLESVWFGSGADLKAEALDLALTMAK